MLDSGRDLGMDTLGKSIDFTTPHVLVVGQLLDLSEFTNFADVSIPLISCFLLNCGTLRIASADAASRGLNSAD